jgi:hypothetical protein
LAKRSSASQLPDDISVANTILVDEHVRLRKEALLDGMVRDFADLAARPVAESLIVTVGDDFDRGPNSRGVIERLRNKPFPTRDVPLRLAAGP